MKNEFVDKQTGGMFRLSPHPSDFIQNFNSSSTDSVLSIIWNTGAEQQIELDGIFYALPSRSIIPLISNSSFKAESSKALIVWEFNQEFYCIIDHDTEVSCVGFIFYGNKRPMFIRLERKDEDKINALLQVFKDEFSERDDIQGEMLRMLLKRLIILVTRIGREQYMDCSSSEFDLLRKYNMLVESNFRKLHQVQDYAQMLNKSPKTLSNLFNKNNNKTPLTIIKDRIALEAKRLLQYTDKTSKEIAYELGFEDPSYFSRFFKSAEGLSPVQYKKKLIS